MSLSKVLKPRKLKPGDRVAAISLSWGGPGAIPHRFEAGKQQFSREFDVEVVETRHALRDPEWLRRNPEARANDLMEAFSDPLINGIISTIGGDDSIRLLPYLRSDVIAANPKVFMGYSDTTVSHLACFRAGLVSFYGPTFMAGFGENGGMFPYMVESVRKSCFSAQPIGVIEPNTSGWTVEHLDWNNPDNQQKKRRLTLSGGWRYLQGSGRVQGPLIGGCVEVLNWLRGTSLSPQAHEFEKAILFLETSEEGLPPQALERTLRVYASMSLLQKLSGIIFGRPGGQISVDDFPNYDKAILRVVVEEEGLTHMPIVTNMDFGHTDPMCVLPYGANAQIDCENQRFEILESAVID